MTEKQCPACDHPFDSPDGDPFCSSCVEAGWRDAYQRGAAAMAKKLDADRQWRRFSVDCAPENDQQVWFVRAFTVGFHLHMGTFRNGVFRDCFTGDYAYSITHWMPCDVPELPK